MQFTGARRSLLWPAGLACTAVVLTPADAWAYVDPGAGSYLFQLLVAGLFAGMYGIRRAWQGVSGVLRTPAAAASAGRPRSSTDDLA